MRSQRVQEEIACSRVSSLRPTFLAETQSTLLGCLRETKKGTGFRLSFRVETPECYPWDNFDDSEVGELGPGWSHGPEPGTTGSVRRRPTEE